MKTFLLFVSGMLSAAIAIALGVFFFLQNSISNVEPVKNVPKKIIAPDNLDEIVTITGKIIMPPEIRIYKPGEGHFRARILYGRQFDKVLGLAVAPEGASFPQEFSRKLPRKEFEQMIQAAQGNFLLAAAYAPNKNTFVSRRIFSYFEPTAMTFVKLPADFFEKKTNIFNLGEHRLNRVAPQAFTEKCRSETILLDGKINPPKNLQKAFGGDKLALVIYPDSPFTSSISLDAAAQEFDKNVLHYQYLNFSHGPVSFSAPYKPSHSSLLKVVVVRCLASEDLKACALKAFPPANTFLNEERVFEVRNKNYEIGLCGETGFVGQFSEPLSN